MIPGLKVIGWHHTPFTQFNILAFVFALGDIACCKIGDIEQPGCLFIANLSELGFDGLEIVTQLRDSSQQRLNIFTPGLGLTYGFGTGITFAL